MKRVILLKGLPASGKSTWAKEQLAAYPGRYKRISKDMLRAMLDNGAWSRHNEKFVLKVRDSLILAALAEGYHVLVDDTNLHPKHEAAIRELVKGLAIVEIQDFTYVPLEVCLERDRHRPDYVGEQTIRKMYCDFLQPPRPHYQPDPTLSRAVICDIDGTLALTAGRDPYDAANCEQDKLNIPVAAILRNLLNQPVAKMPPGLAAEHILLVSGRQECHREPTERWLAKHGIVYTALWMRPTGDQRKDVLIKEEIYKQQIEGRYAIMFALDDRNQTVAYWRSLGIPTFQVAEGDF